jgi:hypothetical protein
MGKLSEAQRKWVNEILPVLGAFQQLDRAAQPKINPADVAKRRVGEPEWNPVQGDDNTAGPTTFGQSANAVQDGDGRLSGDVEYDKLVDDIKSRISRELWDVLAKRKQQRWTLVETYSRLKKYGLWNHVIRVVGEKEKPERHVEFKGYAFAVAGNSGGIIYEAKGGFLEKLTATPNIGVDGSIVGALHSGQTSLREWGDSTSLHISVGPGKLFDAHIDKVSPVSKPADGRTQIDPVEGPKHWSNEVLPEKIRKKIKIPGVSPGGYDPEHKDIAQYGKIEWRPVDKKKKEDLGNEKRPGDYMVSGEAMKNILQALARTKHHFPISVGTIPDEVPTAEGVARIMAPAMMEAAKARKNTVVADVAYYLNKKEDHNAALAMMQEIGQIVRSKLLPQAEVVTRLTVTFGTYNQGGTESIAD